MQEISKDTTLSELLKTHPKVIKGLFPELAMECLGCKAVVTDTIEKAAMNHGKDVDKLLKEIKKRIRQISLE
jgi:hybrid cluster-associated redox disulfide protein